MVAEFQRSEIMSGAPSSSESASLRSAQADVSADAALILAALGRMEAVVRDERAAFTRLRVMLGEMAQAIARGKAVADSETAATLLDELEHRVDAMLDIAGPGPVAEAAAIPDPQPSAAAAPVEAQAIQHPAGPDQVPTVSDVVSRFGSDDEPPPAAAAPQPVEDTATGAPTVAMLTAMVEALRDSISPAAPEPEAALESPTPQAADVVTQPLEVAPQPETSAIGNTEVATTTVEAAHLAEPPDAEVAQAAEATYPAEATEAAHIPPPAEPKPDNSAFVAMLRARLAELQAAEAAAAPEPAVIEVAAQLSDAAPPPEASAIDGAETVAPTAEIVDAAEPEHFAEAPEAEASRAIEATHTEAAADVPPPADPAPDNSAFVAMLNARLAALQAAAAESPQPGDAAPLSEAIQTTDVAEAAPISDPAVAGLHESALLASLQQMRARPFPPPDEGTAVIFAPKPEFQFLPEFGREPAASTEPPSEPEQAVTPQPATAAAETPSAAVAPDGTQEAPSEAAAASETAESDFDPADFLFGPEPEPDPAAFLLDPAPPQPPASPAKPSVVAPPAEPAAEKSDTSQSAEPDSPAQNAPHDPLRALKALSENEKLALFS